MKEITIEQTTDMILAACQAIIDNKPYLTEVDSKTGDGDHGIGMAGGMEKAGKAPKSVKRQEMRFVKNVRFQTLIPFLKPLAWLC